jgi:hypothetical protein
MSNKLFFRFGVLLFALASTTGFIIRGQQQTKPDAPMTQQHMDEMNKRGDQAMGFDHLKTTHHFRLAKDGGSIEVEANDANDKQSRDQIRMHLSHIAMMFSDGNFKIPMLVHDENPPGADVMRELRSEINYQYKETERGGLVRISTANAKALRGIFDFLRYQIKEHMTGDSLDVPQK